MTLVSLFLPSPSLSLSPPLGADVTDYFNYGFTEDTWRYYCEKQKKMRAEVTSINKIVVSSLNSRNSAWTNKWYSRARRTHTVAQILIVGWTCSCSLAVAVSVMRYDVECWLLCNEFKFVMIKDDFDIGTHLHPSVLR